MPKTYREVAQSHGKTGVVIVESVGDIEGNFWDLELAAAKSFIVGVVGYLDPFALDFDLSLQRCSEYPGFVGFCLHTNCCRSCVGNPNQGRSEIAPEPVSSLESVRERNLAVDFHGGWKMLDYAGRILDSVPGLRLVTNHITEWPPIDGGASPVAWKTAVSRISSFPEFFCKVLALVQMTEFLPAVADAVFYTSVLEVLWKSFGQGRWIYGSNWPQLERFSDFVTSHQIVTKLFETNGSDAEESFFWECKDRILLSGSIIVMDLERHSMADHSKAVKLENESRFNFAHLMFFVVVGVGCPQSRCRFLAGEKFCNQPE